MAHWLRPIYAGAPQGEWESRFRRTASTVLLMIEYWIAMLFSGLAIRPLLPASLQRPPAALFRVAGLIAIAGTAVLMWLGQGDNGIPSPQRPDSASTTPLEDRTEARFGKLGVFYFNRNDPSVMDEKRFGSGYTVNFAHPKAGIIMLLPVPALIAVTITITVKHAMRRQRLIKLKARYASTSSVILAEDLNAYRARMRCRIRPTLMWEMSSCNGEYQRYLWSQFSVSLLPRTHGLTQCVAATDSL